MKTKLRICTAALSLLLALTLLASAWVTPALAAPPAEKLSDEQGRVTSEITLDDGTKTVCVDGEETTLTPIEYSILRLLMRNPGKVYSTKALYEEVWQEAALGSEGAVAVHIRHLREKIEINPKEPKYLKVVWGIGYKID